MKCIVLAISLLFASNASAQLLASAPWSEQEHTSLQTLAEACGPDMRRAFQFVASDWKSDPLWNENRAMYSDALAELAQALNQCSDAWGFIDGSQNRATGDRPTDVASARSAIAGTITRTAKVAALLPAESKGRQRVEEVLAKLGGFDPSLEYLSFQGSDWPNIIGSHGDFPYASGAFEHGNRYLLGHTLWDMGRIIHPDVTPLFTVRARDELNVAFAQYAKAVEALTLARAIEAKVITVDVWADIECEVQAGAGIRPADFFASVRALEYVFASGNPPSSHCGRNFDTVSFAHVIFNVTQKFASATHIGPESLAAVNGPEWLWAQMNRAGINIGDKNTRSLIAHFYSDILDGWGKGSDPYGWGVMGFFHGIPAPPQ